MAESRTDVQKRRLEELNKLADNLVANILYQIDEKGDKVEAKDLNALNTIINKIESMQFNGNVEMLRNTVQVYQKAINAIDEQLKSKEMKEFEKFSMDSLKEAKKYIEDQSKNGRVGYIFDQVEKLTEQELSGKMEQEYNNEKIADLDYAKKNIEEKEEKRKEPFRKVKSEINDDMKNVNKYHEISERIKELKKEKLKLSQELEKLKNAKEGDLDKEEKEKGIKERTEKINNIDKEIQEIAKEAKQNKDDKTYDLKENEKITEYIDRVEKKIEEAENHFADKVKEKLKGIGDNEIELGVDKKQKISEYLKDYIEGKKDIYGLDEKLNIDAIYLADRIKEQEEHKKLEKLEEEKQTYQKRNEDLQADMDAYEEISHEDNKSTGTGTEMVQFKEPNFIKKWFMGLSKKGRAKLAMIEEQKAKIAEQKRIEAMKKEFDERRKTVEKDVLQKVEEEDRNVRGNAFTSRLKVDQKNTMNATVKNNMNKNRNELYRKMAEEAAKNKDGEGR